MSARRVDCTFRVSGKIPELWHPDTGRSETLALYRQADGCTTIPINFDPVGSVFVIFRPGAPVDNAVSITKAGQAKQAADAPTPRRLADGAIELDASEEGTYELILASGKKLTMTAPQLPAQLPVEGAWDVTFPPKMGAPARATFDRLICWTDSTDDGIRYFSGTATYEKQVEIPAVYIGKGKKLILDLGAVKNLASVSVNGEPLGILWKEPFRVDITSAAKAGANDVEINVVNLWPNRLIGDQKLPEDKRITWASHSVYKADSPLLPSGLLGPVKVIPMQTVRLGN
jgi:hypothetical protein